MKALFLFVLAVFFIHHAPAFACSPGFSPLIGNWAVDVSRLPMPPEARPKSVTIKFSDEGCGKWTTKVEITEGSGAKNHAEGTATLDGTPTPVTGSLEADITALEMPTPDVLIMQLGKGSKPASTRVYAVAADGKTMIETVAYFEKDGKPMLRTNHFKRVR